ncbi:hypothetical protein HYQ46_011924 [Verticillium longisporum]|nr:hypothetical protein HYQ46_011924 [Verticillium longisporum]
MDLITQQPSLKIARIVHPTPTRSASTPPPLRLGPHDPSPEGPCGVVVVVVVVVASAVAVLVAAVVAAAVGRITIRDLIGIIAALHDTRGAHAAQRSRVIAPPEHHRPDVCHGHGVGFLRGIRALSLGAAGVGEEATRLPGDIGRDPVLAATGHFDIAATRTGRLEVLLTRIAQLLTAAVIALRVPRGIGAEAPPDGGAGLAFRCNAVGRRWANRSLRSRPTTHTWAQTRPARHRQFRSEKPRPQAGHRHRVKPSTSAAKRSTLAPYTPGAAPSDSAAEASTGLE